MKQKRSKLFRLTNGLTALAFSLGLAVPALTVVGTASAAQLTSASIMMSSADSSATGVSYQVGFTPVTSATIKGIVVDFCDVDPIIGDACTAPTGFSVGTPTVAISGGNNTGLTGTWTAGLLNTGRTLTLTSTTGTALSSSTPVIFTLSTAANPSSNGTFYARILTFTTSAGATGYTATATGADTDDAGVALSINSVVQITARVMPTLSFCVSGAAPTGNCGGTTSTDIVIGHGSTVKVIDNTAVDTTSVYSQLSTNATNGANIRAKINNACGGLSKDLGSNCNIAPMNASGNGVPTLINSGDAKFGLLVESGTNAVAGSSGAVTAASTYNDGTHTTCGATGYFALSKVNMTSTFGDTVASASAPVNQINNQYCFGASASLTTPAGVYVAEINLIATGTF